MKIPPFALFALLLICPLVGSGQNRVAEYVYEQVSPSVVQLANIAGSGTGIILDDSGLILTNAHVVATPMPYSCKVDVVRDGKLVRVTFKRVRLISKHPDKDLALVKIDPAEQKGELIPATMSKSQPAIGQNVYAIGNPAAGSTVLEKTITSGLLSGRNREIEGIKYYQIDASINPGNSGGPICNENGEVIGVATLKATEVEGVGFALPVTEIEEEIKEFEDFDAGSGDQAKARERISRAKSFAQQAMRYSKEEDEERQFYFALAASLYNEAIIYDPKNYEIYFNCGLLYAYLEKLDDATAYLVQAIEMAPNSHRNDYVYRQLGICLKQNKLVDEAAAAWHEGALKHPDSGYCWDLYARHSMENKNHYEAAYAATLVLQLKPRNVKLDELNELRDKALAKLDEDSKNRIAAIVNSPEDEINKLIAAREQNKTDSGLFMDGAFAEFVNQFGEESSANEKEEVIGTWSGKRSRAAGLSEETNLLFEKMDEESKKEWTKEADTAIKIRTWVDQTGEFRIEAKFIEVLDDEVRLEKADGTLVTVQLSTLSKFDQKYVEKHK